MKAVSIDLCRQEFVRKAFVPESFFERARGLLGRNGLPDGEGMLFENCRSIHMVGMRFSIDVIFLDSQMRICKLVERLLPFQMSSFRSAAYVLEVAAGTIEKYQLSVGRQLTVRES